MRARLAKTIAALAAVAAAGVGGYLIGHAQSRPTATQTTVSRAAQAANNDLQYQAGVTAGHQAGEQDGRVRGYNDGLKRANGILRQTVNDSFDAGAKAIFDGFGSPWSTGSYYIVKIAPGSGGAPYQLSSRLQMDPSDYYNICPSSGDLCGDTWAHLIAAFSGNPSPPSGPTDSPPTTAPDSSSPSLDNLSPTYPVICGDGTLSLSGGHSGACSHHGGEL